MCCTILYTKQARQFPRCFRIFTFALQFIGTKDIEKNLLGVRGKEVGVFLSSFKVGIWNNKYIQILAIIKVVRDFLSNK